MAHEYSASPDFKALIEFLLHTLTEQFATANTFAILQHPFTPGAEHNYFATGFYVNHDYLKKLKITVDHSNYFIKFKSPQRVKNLDLRGRSASLGFMLAECDVELIVPLVFNQNVIGLLGLGSNVNKEPYDDHQIDTLATLVHTITPFIVNSFLFMEISGTNKLYQELYDNIKQGIFIFDRNAQLKKLNAPGFRILRNFKPNVPNMDSLYGVGVNWIFPENIYPGLIRHITQSKSTENFEFSGILRAGFGKNQKLFNLNVIQVPGKPSEDSEIIVSMDDISSQKNNELKFFELEKFGQRASLASSLADQLDRFHNAVTGGLELIRASSGMQDPEKIVSHLSTLTEKLKDIEAVYKNLKVLGKYAPRKQPVNLNNLVSEIISYVKVQERFKRTVIGKKFDDIPEQSLDQDQIAYLLIQILNNAADAINQTNKDNGEVIVKTYLIDNQVELSVSDNGGGMKAEVRGKLFKTHCTTKGENHGWGLLTCSKILDNHNCQVDFDSSEDKGTTFRVKFSKAKPESSLKEITL